MTEIIYSRAATRTLRRMPRNTAERIIGKIKAYAEDPASQANNVTALTGYDAIRLRVGDWRVIMNHEGEVLQVIKIASRGEVYKGT